MCNLPKAALEHQYHDSNLGSIVPDPVSFSAHNTVSRGASQAQGLEHMTLDLVVGFKPRVGCRNFLQIFFKKEILPLRIFELF